MRVIDNSKYIEAYCILDNQVEERVFNLGLYEPLVDGWMQYRGAFEIAVQIKADTRQVAAALARLETLEAIQVVVEKDVLRVRWNYVPEPQPMISIEDSSGLSKSQYEQIFARIKKVPGDDLSGTE